MDSKVTQHLSDKSLFAEQAFVGGAWISADSGKAISVTNPANGEVIGTVPDCGARETSAAIDAAREAFDDWRNRSASERGAVLEAWHALIIEHRDDLAMIMTLEQGKPLAEAVGEIGYGASFVKWFAEEARRVYGETIPAPTRTGRIIVQKQPIGVAAAITPWNFPTAMITRKAAPALAAGCTIVIKPSELTPFSALALGVLADRAGMPAGVLNIVTGDPIAVGGALTKSPVVRKLSFTGSTRVGKMLMEQCASTVKRLSLELGGNAPFIVFDDAYLNAAVEGVVASKFRNGGQTCVCANRILVQEGTYDAFAKALTNAVSALSVGNGLDAGIHIGPMINEAAVQKIETFVSDAVGKGAKATVGGNRAGSGALFFEPTVLTGANSDMRLAQEEIFGPVAPLIRFRTEAEAVAMANDTPYGLAAYVYTQDLSRGLRVGDALEFGMVGLNSGTVSTEVAPFGGVKEAGLGREGSRHGIEEFLEMKTFHLGGL